MKKVTKLVSIFAASAMLFGAMNFMSCSDGSSGGSGSDKPKIEDNDDGTVTITIEEEKKGFISAKNGSADANITTHAKFPGYVGKYLDGLGENSAVIYAVDSEEEQDAKVSLRYAYWGSTTDLRGAYVVANGVQDDEIIYCNWTSKTGNGDNTAGGKSHSIWEKSNEITVHLAKGVNQIRVIPVPKGTAMPDAVYPSSVTTPPATKVACGNLPNIDSISLTGKGLAAGDESVAYYVLKTSVNNEKYGEVTVSADGTSFETGTKVTVTAAPKTGYVFNCWTGDLTSNQASVEITMTKDYTLVANFISASFDKATELKGLEGYAAICDDKGTAYTVTGGFGGQEITLSSVADIEANKAKISGNDPYIIKVAARITTVDNKSLAFDVGSNKTLIGEKGKDFGFKNINPKISGENVIVKNLHFGDVIGDDLWGGAGNDALSIKGGKHIWIDHCEFSSSIDPKNNDGTPLSFAAYKEAGGQVDLEGEDPSKEETKWKKDFYDGLLDVSELSRFVSVSNCYFHDHWKACLCGGSNDKIEQQPNGSLVRLTMYNNYFNNIHARQPLFRFGKAHIYSSYLYGADDASGIEVRAKSEVYVDNVYFENFKKSVGCWNSSSGDIGAGAWTVKDCVGETATSSTSYVPPYTWTKTSASDSKANLPGSAGIEK